VDITSLIGTLTNWPASGISGGRDAAPAASGGASQQRTSQHCRSPYPRNHPERP
jgi:hypothetical protein